LNGTEFAPLIAAFNATMSLSRFDRMLKENLDIDREDIALGNDKTEIVFRVVDEANRAGWVWKLVNAARQERPDYPVFVEYAQKVGMAPRGLPDTSGLESIIEKSRSLLDIARFRSQIGEIEGRVCRVDLRNGARGTGFLVGPGLVLTNYHVVEPVIQGANAVQEISCLFDFKMSEDGTRVGSGISGAVRELVCHSPYDQEDLSRSGTLPNADNLDYALLRLSRELGNEPLSSRSTGLDSPKRGWLPLKSDALALPARSPLFIVQHPQRQPMKLALDTEAVLGVNANGTRVQYRTNTDHGSSGAPCFNENWRLVALHHSGDPSWIPTWNEGIPIWLIAAQVANRVNEVDRSAMGL
jgi:hypothetical protein